jgi:hypothetical protein
MDSATLREELQSALSPAARQAIRDAMDQAHRDAGRHFDPGAGSDPQLHGFTVYKFGRHRLTCVVSSDGTLGLRIATAKGQFRLGFGRFIMTPYTCGLSAPVDPWTEFPNNDDGAGLLTDVNTGQHRLDLTGEGEEPTMAIVLAHYGNWDTGLEALYLKVPSAQSNGRITAWSYVEELWRIDGTVARPTSPDLPRPVSPERPKLTLKKSNVKPGTERA